MTLLSQIDLDVQYAVSEERLPPLPDFQMWAEAALANRRESAELVIRLVDEIESAALNQQYRNTAGATNVLSFPFQAPPQVESDLLGDLVICAPLVLQQAIEQQKAEQAHWAHMVVHGVLHLLGYDHIEVAQIDEMENLEVGILAQLGFPDPYT
ncbi:Metal-dependent hydrolase YbeY, involved in rRNA and/or ribosome maturation and assembly [hydrothermal vent metagenome]|uniref:Metal-dependent hydrolase YbeY, involved in rRNA and/or ribosome maturation and assembly n=1 Tax=hydrothermal vent metagenome TaxID=652676 RepID=A0A3B1AYQ6_9ZZZZ